MSNQRTEATRNASNAPGHGVAPARRGNAFAITAHGRLARADDWRAFPFLVALPLFVVGAALWLGASMVLAMALGFGAALPLFSAGARRLQDRGNNGHQAVAPWGYFAAATLFCGWGASALLQVSHAFAQSVPPDGPGGLGFVIVFGYGGGLLVLSGLVLFLLFLAYITPAVAQTLVRSDPGLNRFGPTPYEAP